MNLHRLMKWAAALLLIGVAAGGAGMGMLARSAPPEPERHADRRRGREPIPRDDSTDGATVEVVGISTVPTGPKTWWKPDGSPLAEAPVDTIERMLERNRPARAARDPGANVRGAEGRQLPMAPDRPTAATAGGRPDEGRPEGAGAGATTRPRSARGSHDCEVQVRLAGGPWKTEVSNDGGGGVGMFVNGHKFAFGKARPSRRTAGR